MAISSEERRGKQGFTARTFALLYRTILSTQSPQLYLCSFLDSTSEGLTICTVIVSLSHTDGSLSATAYLVIAKVGTLVSLGGLLRIRGAARSLSLLLSLSPP
jgi:hypothetical protein